MSKLKEISDREFIKDKLPLNSKGNVIWKDTPNKPFSIRYDGVVYDFTITKYDKNTRTVYFSYNNNEYYMHTSNLLKCNIGFIIGYLSSEFKYNIGDIVNNYKIIEMIRIPKKNKKTYRAYKVECIKDKYITTVSECELDRGRSCPVCDNKVVIKGINDMWTTHPALANLLKNKEDGFLYTAGSNKKLNWVCPLCNKEIKNKTISYIKRDMNVHCPYCNDGFTYPEKLMSNILSSFNVEFKTHYRIPNQTFKFENRDYIPEYDFYFEYDDNKYIIEMDGDFHNKVHSKSNLTIKQIKEIDNQKDLLATKNNIIFIRIDCKYSNYDYILNSIKNSILSKMFDLSKLCRKEINKKAYSSNIVEACHLYMTKTKNLNTISKILDIPYGTIYGYLKRGAEIGLCNYDPNFSLKNKGNLDFVGIYEFIL